MQYDAGEYSQALLEFTELGNYKDALEWVEKCRIALYGEDWYEFIKTCKVGQEFSLGTYYSDAIKSEYTTSLNAGDIEKPEKSPIEWTII